MDAARSFAIQRFTTDLLDSIDNLDRALQTVPEASLKETTATPSESEATHAKDLRALHSGLKMTEEILLNTLKKHGVERFDPAEREGRRFDPNLDEATFFMKVEGKGEGEVFHTQSKGYTLNGRVVRAAKVGVVKNA
jgi:molecular chaperone GrpE